VLFLDTNVLFLDTNVLPPTNVLVKDTSVLVKDTSVLVGDTGVLVPGVLAPPGRGTGILTGCRAPACRAGRLLPWGERRHGRHRVSVCHPAARCLEA
jgi:hypothetical protein